MKDDLRERRRKEWLLYIVRGVSHGKVCERLAAEHDCAEGTIAADLTRMDDWLPRLDSADLTDGTSRMRETRENRQRMQQMALKARERGDLELEMKIRRRIDQAIGNDIDRSQSLGKTPEEPDRTELTGEDGGPFSVEINDSIRSTDDAADTPDDPEDTE